MPTLSVAMIVKDVAGYIEPCLRSFEHNVDELVIVDTGSTDKTKETISHIWTKALQYIEINERTHPDMFMVDSPELETYGAPGPFSGRTMLADFGGARQIGWERGTQEYLMWVDSDDVVEHAERLPEVLTAMARERLDVAILSYDYDHDEAGNVTCRLLRERIVNRITSKARWVQPVHEVFFPIGTTRKFDEVNVVHRRRKIGTKAADVPHRNIKILLRHYDREKQKPQGVDPRVLFYLGMEMRFHDHDKAIGFFREYLAKSGWDEERATARLWIGELLESRGRHQEAFNEYAGAAVDFSSRPDAMFALSRNAYYRNDWQKCIEFVERGWALLKERGAADSVIQYDPMQRTLMPLVFASRAYLEVGRAADALRCCVEGLAIKADEPHLLGNKQLAEKILNPEKPPSSTERLLFQYDKFLEEPARDLHPNIYTVFALELWKRLREDGDYVKATTLLANVPACIDKNVMIEDARKRALAPNGHAKTHAVETTRVTMHDSKWDILIWTGPAWENWSPKSIDTTGIGGSETAAVKIGQALAARGHRVRVLAQAGQEAGIYDGIEFVDYTEVFQKDFTADVLIASRQPQIFTNNFFGHRPRIKTKTRILWVHDIHCGNPTPELEEAILRADKIFCLSHWHKGFFLGIYPSIAASTIEVTTNSVDLSRFKGEPQKKNHMIYASSPDRGLLRLLELFPRIRARVPDVELHVYYGFHTWESMANRGGNVTEHERINGYKQLLQEHADRGVFSHGRVGQQELAQAFMTAKVWPYPTWFSETNCITAQEAQAAGCVPVTTALAALNETVKHGLLLPPPETTEAYANAFVDKVVELLTNENARKPIADAARAYAFANYGWDKVAAQWEKVIATTIAEREVYPLVPYGVEELPAV